MKYKKGENIEFIWFNGQVLQGEIVKIVEHKHWFKNSTYEYCIKYPVYNSFKQEQLVQISTSCVKEDDIIKIINSL